MGWRGKDRREDDRRRHDDDEKGGYEQTAEVSLDRRDGAAHEIEDSKGTLRETSGLRPRSAQVRRAAGTDAGADARAFTTVASFANKGKDITYDGVTYEWSKHSNFMRFLDLPRRTSQPFVMAMKPTAGEIDARVRAAGWELVDPEATSRDVDGYRCFIQESRGEFTVAKDIYVRPNSGWFSDRSVCYLASGRPVITMRTGFTKFYPAGRGLLDYATTEEALAALAAVEADYSSHSRAARAVAAEYFSSAAVLRPLLDAVGL